MRIQNLLIISLGILAWSSSAFAIHAYRAENCRSGNLHFSYEGNYPVGGYYRIANSTDSHIAIPNVPELYSAAEIRDADVLFTEVSMVVTNKPTLEVDSNWEHSEWTSTKVIRIERASLSSQNRFQIEAGREITFKCHESSTNPI